MKEISIRELKEIELDILSYVHKICEKNNLKYYLAYGTLLGAVRHKGFIPWDDDIDIWVPIEDYAKLLDIIQSEGSKYRVLDYRYDSSYYYPFAKVVDKTTTLIEYDEQKIEELGVYIDVFPLIGQPGNKLLYNMSKLKLWYYRQQWRYSAVKSAEVQTNILKKILRYVPYRYARSKGTEYWLEKIRRYEEKNHTKNRKYVGDIYGARADNFLINTCVLLFENREYCVPKSYDIILKSYYGNYMILPPKENQVSNHNFKAYYKEQNEVYEQTHERDSKKYNQ